MAHNQTIHGLRGLSSLLVVFFHIYGMAYIGGFFEQKEVSGIFVIIDNLGPMSVNLFFMISGYLIVGSLARHGNIKKFMINRIIRIYPVFLCLHLVVFSFGPFINYEWLGDVNFLEYIGGFISNLFLLPGVFELPIAQKNAWSLSYEFAFYVFSALFFLALLKVKKKPIRIVAMSFLIMLSAVTIYFHPKFLFFILGVIIYYSEGTIKSKYSYKKYYYFNGILLLPIIFFIYNMNNMFFGITSLILSLILFWIVVNEEGLLSKILKSRPLQFLGTISFSLYLIHPFALFPFKIIFSNETVMSLIGNEYLRILLFGLSGTFFAIVGSYISYILLEDKLTFKLKNNIKRKESIRIKKQQAHSVS